MTVLVSHLKPVDVLLRIFAAGLTACNLICQLVNDDVKRTLFLQRVIKIKLQ